MTDKTEETVPSETEVSDKETENKTEMQELRVPSPADVRVTWIYKLRKEDLTTELEKFRLDSSGTVDEKRKRLIRFIRDGQTSPQPTKTTPFLFPTAPPTTENTQKIHSPKVDLKEVRKWNVYYNGKGDPAAFIERLEELCVQTQIPIDNLLPILPELLKDAPLLWYRSNNRHWRTWQDFVNEFRTYYFPVNYLEDLEADISRRLQRPGEPVTTYLTDLQTLIRRHGKIPPSEELRWLYRNMLPEYKLYIRKDEIDNTPTLAAKMREYEDLQRAIKASQSPACSTRPSATTHTTTESSRQKEQKTDQRPLLPSRPSRTQPMDVTRRPPPSTHDQTICWRCGQTGHLRADCHFPPRIFCSRCGQRGVMSRDCRCNRSENAAGTATR